MGKRGPPPTPTAILAARGSWRAKIRRDEPQTEIGIGKPPKQLTVEERKVWRWLQAELDRMGVGGKADVETLARYCRLRVVWWQLPADDPNWLKVDNALLRIEREFGLTASARARLSMDAAPQPRSEPQLRSKIVG